MNAPFKDNINLIRKKIDAAQVLTTYCYRDAAVLYRAKYSSPADCEAAVRLYESIHGGKFAVSSAPSYDFAVFCREFAAEVPIKFSYNQIYDNSSDENDNTENHKIAYLQNTFSDKAYRIFSSKLQRVSAVYFPGFREACEEVYYGRCLYTILPVFNSHDGILMSFYKLMLKYDLKIIMVCIIEMNDESVMKYALLSKDLPRDVKCSLMELSIVLPDNERCGGFISACEALGAYTVMLNSYPLEYSDEKYGLILHLDVSNADINSLYLFLEGSRIRYDIVGMY